MSRKKLARKVLNYEVALLKVPLSVFESTVGDRLPPDSRLRRTVEMVAGTLDAVTKNGRKKHKGDSKRSAAHPPKPPSTTATEPDANPAATRETAVDAMPRTKPAKKAAKKTAQKATQKATKKATAAKKPAKKAAKAVKKTASKAAVKKTGASTTTARKTAGGTTRGESLARAAKPNPA